MRALIIENTTAVTNAISLCLQLRWPEIELETVTEGRKGVEILRTNLIDLIILDINLPDIDSFEVIQKMRSFSKVPIVVVSSKNSEKDCIRCLEIGADDYIVKPLRPRTLVARINAILRRYRTNGVCKDKSTVVRGNMELSLANNEVIFKNTTTKLTPTEAKLLHVLMGKPEETLKGKHIAQEVWHKPSADAEEVRTYVRRLRSKLRDNPPRIILTDHGEGYKFVSPS